MPTAARLFAAIGFAAMAFFATSLFVRLLPEGTQLGMFLPVNVAIGAMAGWLVMGRLAGRGYFAAAGSGVRTTAVLLFYALLVWSLYEMLRQSMRLAYADPGEALTAMVGLIAEYVMMMVSDPQMIAVLVLGGILAAFFAEWASERFA